MATFANTDARLGFVMPGGVLSADRHRNLIECKYSGDAKLKLTGYWALWDVAPLFNVPACVLFAIRSPLRGSVKDKLPVLEWQGKLPGRDVGWDVAKKYLSSTEKEGRVIYLGSRPALSTAPSSTSPTKPSQYLGAFKQGATIVPRSIYFVKVTDLGDSVDPIICTGQRPTRQHRSNVRPKCECERYCSATDWNPRVDWNMNRFNLRLLTAPCTE